MKTKIPYLITLLLIVTIFSNSFAQDNTQVGLPEGAIARFGKGGINIMRFSPDGTHLAVGTDVGLWLYDVPDGNETALFTGHTGHINALAFSDDGRFLASGGYNNPVIQVWDIPTKSKHTTIKLNLDGDVLTALVFYGRTLISLYSGHSDRQLTYWHVDTGKKLSEFSLDDSYNNQVFSQDGSHLAVNKQNGGIRLWDTTTNKIVGTLLGHGNERDSDILTLAFSQNKKILASGSEDKTVKLWDTQDHNELATLKGHDAWITAAAFSDDGKTLASGDAGKVIKLWDMESRKERATLIGHKKTINALTFAPVGAPDYSGCLASGSADGTIRIWNPENGEELVTFTTGHTEWIKALAFSEDSTTLSSAAFNGTVDIWSLKTHQEIATFTDFHCDTTWTVALSPNAQLFACHGRKGTIQFNPVGIGARSQTEGASNTQLWNVTVRRKLVPPWQMDRHLIYAVTFSPDNNILAIRDRQEIRAWHINTGIELFQFNMERSRFDEKLAFSPDGKKLAAVSFHRKPQVWDITTQRDITPINIKKASTVAFSPDSSILATLSGDGIYLWKLGNESDEKHTLIPADLNGIENELTFSPDGTILIGSGRDMWSTPIKLWDVETGNSMGTLSGHTETVETLVFSHDGKTLASGSQDGTVLLWDWEQISAKLRNDRIEKNLESNLLPVLQTNEYPEKAGEAEAVKNWLNNNGFQIKRLRSGYRLTHNGSSATISGQGGGIMSVGDVTVTINRKGVLNIRIGNVGTGTFTFDEKGNLKFKGLDE